MTVCEHELELLIIIDSLQEGADCLPDQGQIMAAVRSAMDLTFQEALDHFGGNFVGYLTRLCEKGLIDKTYKHARTRWLCTDAGRAAIHEKLD